MKNIEILKRINEELKENIDTKYKEESKKFYKQSNNSVGVSITGVRTPIVRKIAKKYFKDIKSLKKEEILNLCEQLLREGYNEKTTIAIQWTSYIKLEEKDFKTLERWLKVYIDNWGKIDDFSLNVISHFIVNYKKYKNNVKSWAKSKNWCERRASAVSFIQGKSWRINKRYINDVFEVALILLKDKEDLVQKGYGWMLKEASKDFQKEVFEFVIKNKNEMPRTALRYAIERMPEELRKKAMIK
ncbi:DNA alkylation repair protein [Candidatus Woesearchaeota archaeon]|nr:DNA alkylation repair protein [Candidatus Woesearchaeota archaeon]